MSLHPDEEAAPEEAFVSEALAPVREYPPIGEVVNDALTKRDMATFIKAAIDEQGLNGHNIDGFNDFILNGLPRILQVHFNVKRVVPNQNLANTGITSFLVTLQFRDVHVGKPVHSRYVTGLVAPLLPSEALIRGITYSGPITSGATLTVTAQFEDGHSEEKIAELPPRLIGLLPIMVGSVGCHTHNCTASALKGMGMDPTDPGGYFIARSQEWAIDMSENITYNTPHIYLQEKAKELVRADFLSQPGGAFENSSQIRVRLLSSHQLTIEINSVKFEKVQLPFFLIYRLFGMMSDRDICETIVFDASDTSDITLNILDKLQHAFRTDLKEFAPLNDSLNREEIIKFTAERLATHLLNSNAANESAVQYLNTDLLRTLDRVFLPHMGQTADARLPKLRFLGAIIHRMFRVWLGVLPPTDRDSYRNKRVHGAGVSLAKSFKTQVNNNVVMPIYAAFRRELRTTPWKDITPATIASTFYSPLNMATDLNRAIEWAITAGTGTMVVRRRAVNNRVSSNVLERKNMLNTISSMRNATTQAAGKAAKQTERADKMRRVHPSYLGLICVAQSADTGESVGTKKQLALTATVCAAGEALPLKLRLLADPDVLPLASVTSVEILRRRLSKLYVGGEWIGCVVEALALARRYRALRREGRVVDRHTTIYWNCNTDDVEFWLDVGRLRRPLLIVDNNRAEYDAALRAAHAAAGGDAAAAATPAAPPIPFVQNVRFTPAHAAAIRAGRLTLSDLVNEGIAEFITAEEQENCYIAASIVDLRRDRHEPLRQYTHCDVEQAIYGLAAHQSPYAGLTQPARVTYETNQGRQTGGWYVLNFSARKDRNRFFQITNQTPLVSTITSTYLPPCGMNIIVALMSYNGNNQEDSVIINEASRARGLFNGVFFRYEQAELEKGERFCTPDIAVTRNMKPHARYEKLVNGFVREGSIVTKGDVLIGRVAEIKRRPNEASADAYRFTDNSVIYNSSEPAVVERVLLPRGPNDEMIAIVKLRLERPLVIGDKLSSRQGNKCIVAELLAESDMPFTESGLKPDAIMNEHSLPTRMTIGQVVETQQARCCADRGTIADGTAFMPVDTTAIEDEMAARGFRFNGRERMYNGYDGTYMDVAIYIGPLAFQRLQKFVLDDRQAIAGSGPTDATTGQPLSNRGQGGGGLRIGEMEKDVLTAHGSMHMLEEKFRTDSDGRVAYYCRCGRPAVYNAAHDIYSCGFCEDLADISAVDSTKSALLLREELAASGISLRAVLQPPAFEMATPV